MSVTSIFIVDGPSGDVILEKHYKGITSRASVEAFWDEVTKRSRRDDVPPILVTAKYYLVNIYRNGLYFLAVLTGEMPTLFAIEFLHRVFDTFAYYFDEVTPSKLTDNFSTAFQLLEEMLDNGYPMITEPNALVTLIAPPSLAGKMLGLVTGVATNVQSTIGDGAMSIIPWRRAGVKYVQNEIFFDIIEEIDLIQEANNSAVCCDVRGTINSNCRMSGTPDLTLLFNNSRLIEDCSFHPCVRYARWEREQNVSFVPPDGPFTLMNYRVSDKSPQMPLYCRVDVKWRESSAHVSFTLGAKPMSSKTVVSSSGGLGSSPLSPTEVGVEDIKLVVTFPKPIKNVDLTSDTGHVNTDPITNDLIWTLRSLPRDGKSPVLEGNVNITPGSQAPIESISATLHFVVPNSTVSGLGVKDLLLATETYKFFKGVRTVLKTGRVQIRT